MASAARWRLTWLSCRRARRSAALLSAMAGSLRGCPKATGMDWRALRMVAEASSMTARWSSGRESSACSWVRMWPTMTSIWRLRPSMAQSAAPAASIASRSRRRSSA